MIIFHFLAQGGFLGIFKGREGVTPVSNKAVAKQGEESIIAIANITNNMPNIYAVHLFKILSLHFFFMSSNFFMMMRISILFSNFSSPLFCHAFKCYNFT